MNVYRYAYIPCTDFFDQMESLSNQFTFTHLQRQCHLIILYPYFVFVYLSPSWICMFLMSLFQIFFKALCTKESAFFFLFFFFFWFELIQCIYIFLNSGQIRFWDYLYFFFPLFFFVVQWTDIQKKTKNLCGFLFLFLTKIKENGHNQLSKQKQKKSHVASLKHFLFEIILTKKPNKIGKK